MENLKHIQYLFDYLINNGETYNTREDELKDMLEERNKYRWFVTLKVPEANTIRYYKCSEEISKQLYNWLYHASAEDHGSAEGWFKILDDLSRKGFIIKDIIERPTVDCDEYPAAVSFKIGRFIIIFEHFDQAFDIDCDIMDHKDARYFKEFVEYNYDMLNKVETSEEEIIMIE